MAIQTTTFKGARYIVKFHDPIEWADTESYEAIEAVQHEAYTYISKQPVPAGVQIGNTDFWLLWADPNAQMEQLRQLVAGYVDDVNALETIIPIEDFSSENTVKDAIDAVSVIATQNDETIEDYMRYAVPETYGAVGDGVHDDTEAIQTCIDENDTIVLNGKYLVSSNLVISSPLPPNQSAKTVINNGEIILNNAYVHIYGENVRFEGGIIRGSANGAMLYLGQTPDNEIVSAIKCTVENVYFISENSTPAIVMYNTYEGRFGCYCNTVSNVYGYNTKNALVMIGDVNANNISDVIQWSNAATVESLITFEGVIYNGVTYAPKENNFAQLFYYKGANTPTILYKTNCANGAYRNSFANCTSEQTGNQSHFVEVENDVTGGKNIYVGITTNLYAGDFDGATKQRMIENDDTYIGSSNIFFGIASTFTKPLQLNDTLAIKNKFVNTFTKRQDENTDEKLLTSGQRTPAGIDPMLHGGFIKITLTEFYPNVSRLQHTEEILIHVNANGAMEIAEQIASDSRFSISSNDIMYHTGNNGTSLSAYITCSYEVVCFDGNAQYAFSVN